MPTYLGRDHPRVCGEKQSTMCRMRNVLGSPPRVRGEVNFCSSHVFVVWITPACAGRRVIEDMCCSRPMDHPRVCGEKAVEMHRAVFMQGSPPRVRGEGCHQPAGRTGRGITPACAGRRSKRNTAKLARQDHPRVCGEKSRRAGGADECRGSPPRVRGEAKSTCRDARGIRITPACAGRSASSFSTSSPQGDHPRVCGEKVTVKFLWTMGRGSPPRVRGEDSKRLPRVQPTGITPACAGRSAGNGRRSGEEQDHPRVCGEKRSYRNGLRRD